MVINEFANSTQHSLRDHVWANGSVVRETIEPSSPNAAIDVSTIENLFPTWSHWINRYPRNLIGRQSGYRTPYNNTTITLYVFESVPDNLMTQYNVNTNLNRCDWFGLKFDIVDLTVTLKVPYWDCPDYVVPTTPIEPFHYAAIYKSDGTEHSKREVYFQRGGEVTIKQFCQQHSLTVPAPDEQLNNMGYWSFAYDSDTLAPELVKAYVFQKDHKIIFK